VCVDAAVAGALLDALTPGQVALALSAAGEVAGRHQRASRAAELAVERARYDADRAERAFGQVEPENRLVARSLEARWEARLAALAEAEQALQAAQDTLPPLPSQDDLEKLAADLPALWNAPTTSARDRKRLLRTLIADVTVLPGPDQAKVRIGIRWHAGATDELIAEGERIVDDPGWEPFRAWLLESDRLLERVWGLSFPGGTRTVDVHVGQLRRKLDRPDLIRTVRGAGYKLVP